jgi:hypothetical protein
MDATDNQLSNIEATEAWKEVVSQFRSLCLMRRQGKTADSGMILEQQLPRKIAAWSKSAALDAEVKRAQLEQMFREEQRRVEDVLSFHELNTTQFQEHILPELLSRISNEVKSIIAEQAETNARLRNELAQEIKEALAEQAKLEVARQAVQNAFVHSIETKITELARQTEAISQKVIVAESAAQAAVHAASQTAAQVLSQKESQASVREDIDTSAQSRIAYDTVPTIVSPSAIEEPPVTVHKPFSTRALRPGPSVGTPSIARSLLAASGRSRVAA